MTFVAKHGVLRSALLAAVIGTGLAGAALAQDRDPWDTEMNPDITFECRPGINVRLEAPITADGFVWRSDGCLCADDPLEAKAEMLNLLFEFRNDPDETQPNKESVSFHTQVKLKQGETFELTLYCYNVEEIFEEFGKFK